ncbi:MAG: hypothetical protein COA96_06810 [SAR86 cluster bacterium]|uniref:Uncharacterized protein n=1 Tax=SAR86 cluster bacterium TaxID=2030880 RepID=A0A2A5B315_9GAMM|nr:MAG: hypothetical protein COA96_06810 [SAR86 cluster bacterium]
MPKILHEKSKTLYIRISYVVFLMSVDTILVRIYGRCSGLTQLSGAVEQMSKASNFPFDLDLSTLDTGSITNILNDIELHLPMMESEGDLVQLLLVKEFFESELKVGRRLH